MFKNLVHSVIQLTLAGRWMNLAQRTQTHPIHKGISMKTHKPAEPVIARTLKSWALLNTSPSELLVRIVTVHGPLSFNAIINLSVLINDLLFCQPSQTDLPENKVWLNRFPLIYIKSKWYEWRAALLSNWYVEL